MAANNSTPHFYEPYLRNLSLTLCFLTFAFSMSGQTPEDESEIVTDRPDITESAIVVPPSSLQVENGMTWSMDHGDRTLNLSESLIRIGLSKRTELRISVPNFLDAVVGHYARSGFGDSSIGFKQQLGPLPGDVELSVIVAVGLPSGTRGFSSHGYDPFVKFPWSKSLPRGWSIGGMQSVFWNTQDGRRNRVWEPTFYLERQLTKPWDVFVESAGDYAQRGGSTQVIHFGTAYKVKPKHQVDFHFGFGLNHNTPNRFFAAGYSFRFDNLWRR